MYLLKAIITIDLGRPESPRTNQLLQDLQNDILGPLVPLHFGHKNKNSYYHPDDEAEMNNVNYVTREIFLTRECHKFRSLVYLSQLVQSVAGLFDGVNGAHCNCIILEPECLYD